jgi:hypothetical protein
VREDPALRRKSGTCAGESLVELLYLREEGGASPAPTAIIILLHHLCENTQPSAEKVGLVPWESLVELLHLRKKPPTLKGKVWLSYFICTLWTRPPEKAQDVFELTQNIK